MADRPDFTPDPEEAARIASHFGPEGPLAAVYGWLELVEVGDFAGAWASMDDNLRLCRAQAWLWKNRSDPEIVASDLDEEAGVGDDLEHYDEELSIDHLTYVAQVRSLMPVPAYRDQDEMLFGYVGFATGADDEASAA